MIRGFAISWGYALLKWQHRGDWTRPPLGLLECCSHCLQLIDENLPINRWRCGSGFRTVWKSSRTVERVGGLAGQQLFSKRIGRAAVVSPKCDYTGFSFHISILYPTYHE